MGARSVLVYFDTAEDPAVDQAELLRLTLDALGLGPQWPKTLALRLDLTERDIYPALAELLARGWAEVVETAELPEGGSRVSLCAESSDFAEARNDWLRFFRFSPQASLVTIALTAVGSDAARDLELIRQ